jgi:hypothetical protein
MACYDGELYCPQCVSYRPSDQPPRATGRHRSPSQQAKNDSEGYQQQMEATDEAQDG